MNTFYSGFLATHPSFFSGAKDLLELDDWLRTTKSKFGLLHYTEYQKTLYSIQQLGGSVGSWWASYTGTLSADHHMQCDVFHIAFRGHHLSAGTIRYKVSKFMDLCQGNRSVYDYTQEFNNLVYYSGHHIDNDAKKVELYRQVLTIQLQDHFILSQNLSYNNVASAAIDQEGTMRAYEAADEKKRKRTMPGSSRGSSSDAPPKYHMVYMPPAG
jgi:hypothetical protein